MVPKVGCGASCASNSVEVRGVSNTLALVGARVIELACNCAGLCCGSRNTEIASSIEGIAYGTCDTCRLCKVEVLAGWAGGAHIVIPVPIIGQVAGCAVSAIAEGFVKRTLAFESGEVVVTADWALSDRCLQACTTDAVVSAASSTVHTNVAVCVVDGAGWA